VSLLKSGPRDVLDAGSGNGYFAWARVPIRRARRGIELRRDQVEKARTFILEYRKADPSACASNKAISMICRRRPAISTEIICFEVLEHLRRDNDVVREFYRILRPGGRLARLLSVSRPSRHQAEALDADETGGHVAPVIPKKTTGRCSSP